MLSTFRYCLRMSLNMQLARKWAEVPGVTFPEPMLKLINDSRCVTRKPSPKEWISASMLAKHLGVSTERANSIGMRNDKNFCVYVDPCSPSVRTRYFHKNRVMRLNVVIAMPAEDYVNTHVPLKEAIEMTGLGKAAIAKHVDQGKLHPVSVKGQGRRGIYYLYSKNELKLLKKK